MSIGGWKLQRQYILFMDCMKNICIDVKDESLDESSDTCNHGLYEEYALFRWQLWCNVSRWLKTIVATCQIKMEGVVWKFKWMFRCDHGLYEKYILMKIWLGWQLWYSVSRWLKTIVVTYPFQNGRWRMKAQTRVQ